MTTTTAEKRAVPRSMLALGWNHAIYFLLFLATLLTTTSTGALYAWNFQRGFPSLSAPDDLVPLQWIFTHPNALVLGFPFSFTLLGILFAHESGHWWWCARHHIRTSWPYVIPAPTLSGTAGAIIRIRSRIPSRDALMDVGISGPIAGFIVALPAIIIGILLSKPETVSTPAELIRLNPPLAMQLIHALLRMLVPSLPPIHALIWHPVLLAAWIGLFITALNLVPAGQLDGGHILYAVWRRRHGWITRSIGLLLIVAGITLWAGWLLWGTILLLPAMRHPYVPSLPEMQGRRYFWALAGAALFILTFLPQPFAGVSLLDYLK